MSAYCPENDVLVQRGAGFCKATLKRSPSGKRLEVEAYRRALVMHHGTGSGSGGRGTARTVEEEAAALKRSWF